MTKLEKRDARKLKAYKFKKLCKKVIYNIVRIVAGFEFVVAITSNSEVASFSNIVMYKLLLLTFAFLGFVASCYIKEIEIKKPYIPKKHGPAIDMREWDFGKLLYNLDAPKPSIKK